MLDASNRDALWTGNDGGRILYERFPGSRHAPHAHLHMDLSAKYLLAIAHELNGSDKSARLAPRGLNSSAASQWLML
jgi:hypothetical protein